MVESNYKSKEIHMSCARRSDVRGIDMRISAVYNRSLLTVIYELKDCTINELKQRYLPPEQPGVVQGITVSFDSDVQTLVSMGCISVDKDRVKFINWL